MAPRQVPPVFREDEEGTTATIARHDDISGPDLISPRPRAGLITTVREDC
ncbi:hypothetical protein M4914_08565 [Streptomyces somaliensis DSM 40738]|uniref:Uncharacterized protein n=1 Tax=Streptomyces somaliensis (strain ATCC 33201 / DSM 40738 / JCM 12659 / KCTC 9044 / NCTC 11332 / NRRL B-12077 / IP 733) TaxID=1134445 RepID=A0AA44IEC7_STRE0|nr:hypothetical protein [Streptomyces somaliensis]MCQ0022993.1 hypothetical protein [Streptomyces somaliensis DSM 40738]NKY15442.1 hypothetical protein [Streptomyces somaliensis DSM 40738]